jgi:hypothetical protein
LEFSHWTVASLLPDGGIESLLRGLVDHYVRFEGVPAVAVFAASNGILEPSNLGAEPSSRFAFANAILELGICVRAGPVRKEVRPHGPAERVKRSFFESRDFASRQHMSDELAIWQNEINLQLATRSPRKVPATSIAEERAHLRPVNMDTDHFAIRMPVMIGAEAKVAYDGISYRVPTEMAHTLAALRLYRNRVIIIAGERVVEHERRPIWQ